MIKFSSRAFTSATVALAMGSALVACSSSSTKTAASGTTTKTGSGSSVNRAEAQSMVAQYTGKPSAFPASTPLPRRLPAGTVFGFLQSPTPVGGLTTQILTGTMKALGGSLLVTKAGASAVSTQTAMASLIEKHPAAILLGGFEPSVLSAQIKAANAAKIPIVSTGIMDIEQHGIQASTFGSPAADLSGKLLAAEAVVETTGTPNIVFYNEPPEDFATREEQTFKKEFTQLCPSCSVRYVDVPASETGSTAPSKIVSDLQAHPKTTTAVFAAYETATGLPAALSAAGIKVKTVGFGPTPGNLQDVKQGKLGPAVALDFSSMFWGQADEAARLVLKAPLTPVEKGQTAPVQILRSSDLPADNSKGWTGYPDFAQRFTKLWSPTK